MAQGQARAQDVMKGAKNGGHGMHLELLVWHLYSLHPINLLHLHFFCLMP